MPMAKRKRSSSGPTEQTNPIQLLQDLQTKPELSHQSVAVTGLGPQLALLRTWQSERLKQTYKDLLEDNDSRAVCLFFLSDIYAPRDFSQRNFDVERFYGILSHILPPTVLQLAKDVIELNHRTDDLDGQLLQVLVNELGMSDSITVEQYAEGYRRCDNYAARSDQIDLVVKVVNKIGDTAHIFGVGIALQLLRQPALAAGWA